MGVEVRMGVGRGEAHRHRWRLELHLVYLLLGSEHALNGERTAGGTPHNGREVCSSPGLAVRIEVISEPEEILSRNKGPSGRV